MRLFNNKKHSDPKEKERFIDNIRSFKRNIIDKTVADQQDFEFIRKPCNKKVRVAVGTKMGLSFNFQKIEGNHIEILKKCKPESTAVELMKILRRTNRSKFKTAILNPLIELGFFELTIPETPNSPKQKYRLTEKFVRRTLKFF
jgi:hypothetical protein